MGEARVRQSVRGWACSRCPSGAFGILDGVGLDTVWHITDYWARETRDWQTKKNAAFIKTYIDWGCLGVKTGEGFYRYPHPALAEPTHVTGAEPETM